MSRKKWEKAIGDIAAIFVTDDYGTYELSSSFIHNAEFWVNDFWMIKKHNGNFFIFYFI